MFSKSLRAPLKERLGRVYYGSDFIDLYPYHKLFTSFCLQVLLELTNFSEFILVRWLVYALFVIVMRPTQQCSSLPENTTLSNNLSTK